MGISETLPVTILAMFSRATRVSSPVALVRLLLAEDGAITVTSREITLPTKDTVWRFVISDKRVDEKDPLFYHKTTRRQFYDQEMERQQALTGRLDTEVLIGWNARDSILVTD